MPSLQATRVIPQGRDCLTQGVGAMAHKAGSWDCSRGAIKGRNHAPVLLLVAGLCCASHLRGPVLLREHSIHLWSKPTLDDIAKLIMST